MNRICQAICTIAAVFSITGNVYAATTVKVKPTVSVEMTPQKNMFRIENTDMNFVLLDATEEGYFILSQKYFGTHIFDPDSTAMFDLKDENNIAYWLNNDFWNNGNQDEKLPDKIKEHIIEHKWEVEDEINQQGDKEVTCRIALLSQTEWNKYNNVFGYKDGVDGTSPKNYYFLRSRTNKNIICANAALGGTVDGKSWSAYGVRPVFFIDKNFFNTVRVEVDELGANVRKTICDNNTDTQLKKIYSEFELNALRRDFLPQAENVKCMGIPMEGQVLTGKYKYYSPENDKESGTQFRWLRADSPNGTYTFIPHATKETYTLTKADNGKYIKFEVTPQTQILVGEAVASENKTISVEKGIAPTAKNVTLFGDGYVGERLILDYNFYDENQDEEGNTQIIFQLSEDGKTFKDIQNLHIKSFITNQWKYDQKGTMAEEYRYNFNSGKNYTIKNTQAGKYIRGKIIPKSINYPYDGETVYTEPIYIYEMPLVTASVKQDGNFLSAEYSFDGKENKEDKSVYGWEYSQDKNGEYLKIVGADKLNYKANMSGYYRFFAEPENALGQNGKRFITEAYYIGITDNIDWKKEQTIHAEQAILLIPQKPAYTYSFEITAQNSDAISLVAADGMSLESIKKEDRIVCFVSCIEDKITDASNPLVQIETDTPQNITVKALVGVIENRQENIGLQLTDADAASKRYQ